MKSFPSCNTLYFRTQDIQLAASLTALGATLLYIDRSEPNRSTFVFEDSKDLKQVTQAYWRRQLSIEPQTLLSSFKAVKSRLYGESSEAAR
jgi:hypothetical protein